MRRGRERTSGLDGNRPGRPARRAASVVVALVLGAFVLSMASGACSDSGTGPGGTTEDLVVFEQTGVSRVDIVVLIDNGAGMSEEQAALALRFPEVINELVAPADSDGDTRLDHPPVEELNIGIITPDMGTMGYPVAGCENPESGDYGCFRYRPSPVVPGCPATFPAWWCLSRNRTNADICTPARMAQDFTCLAMLGTGGCIIEQPLKAMLEAVTTSATPGACNAGFLRPDAILALVFVTDSNDCSVSPAHPEMFDADRPDLGPMSLRCSLHPDQLEPVPQYVDAFRSLRPSEDQDEIVLGMIVGVPPDAAQCIGRGDEIEGCLDVPAMREQVDPADPDQLTPSCNTSMGLAFPPGRFVELAQALGANAYVESICNPDWSRVSHGIVGRLVEPILSACPSREPPFDADECHSSCVLLETLSDDRTCPSDPSCLPEWCPPAREQDALSVAPCVDPATGATCEPLTRDLGVVHVGWDRRLCLIRQAERSRSGGACLPPVGEGWYYLPPRESIAGCPQVMFGYGAAGSLVEAGSTARFRCRR